MLLAFGTGSAMSFETGPVPLAVTLTAKSGGAIAAQVNQEPAITPQLLQEHAGVVSSHGITFRFDAPPTGLIVSSRATPVRISVEGFFGWTATAPPDCQVGLVLPDGAKTIRLHTAKAQSASVALGFADGGRAQVGEDSRVCYELFDDQSYLLTGQGRVTATSAEGRLMTLGPAFPPLTGGPLALSTDPTRGTHFQRRSPTAVVKIAGSADGDLTMLVGNKTFTLTGPQRERIPLDNGAVLSVARQPVTDELRWTVQRGDFHFAIDGLPGWTALGLTGQAGAILWDLKNQAVDLKNLSHDQTVLVRLPNRTYAALAPEATLQYKHLGFGLFATAAAHGQVALVDPETGQAADLEAGNLQSPSSSPFATENIPPRQTVSLEWSLSQTLEVHSSFGEFQVRPGDDTVLRGPSGNQLQVQCINGQEVFIKAVAGDYLVYPEHQGSLAVELTEGNGLQLAPKRNAGSVKATAPLGNAHPLQFTVAGQPVSALYPNESVTFLGPSLFTPEWRSPPVVYWGEGNSPDRPLALEDPSPSLPETTDPAWAFGLYQNQLYEDRIPQPPVSVVR